MCDTFRGCFFGTGSFGHVFLLMIDTVKRRENYHQCLSESEFNRTVISWHMVIDGARTGWESPISSTWGAMDNIVNRLS